jgi:hypothetical protein
MHSMHLVNRVQWSTVARKTTSGPSQGQEHDILGIANISRGNGRGKGYTPILQKTRAICNTKLNSARPDISLVP